MEYPSVFSGDGAVIRRNPSQVIMVVVGVFFSKGQHHENGRQIIDGDYGRSVRSALNQFGGNF